MEHGNFSALIYIHKHTWHNWTDRCDADGLRMIEGEADVETCCKFVKTYEAELIKTYEDKLNLLKYMEIWQIC